MGVMSEPLDDNVLSEIDSQGAQNRRSPRVAIDISVQLFTTRYSCGGRGHEVGAFGMAIHVPIDLDEGETIRLMFELPGSKVRFGVYPIGRNRSSFRYGIEFLNLQPAEQAELERAVNALAAPINSAAI